MGSHAETGTADLLTLTDVRKSFPDRPGPFSQAREVLHGVSLHVAPGESVGLVGESGSGKSTLCRIALGLEQPSSGMVTLLGHGITRARERDLRCLRPYAQMIFQNPFSCFDPLRTIGQSLEEPLLEHRRELDRAGRERAIASLMSECALSPELLDRRPPELSGGQLQRLSIVRALLLEPRLVVADEMVSALDVVVQAQVLALFKRLVDERGIGLLRSIADRVVVMREGTIVDEGTVAHIFRESGHPYTQELVRAIPTLPARRR